MGEEDDGIEIPALIEDDECPVGVIEVKAHITWEECYAKRTPYRHMIVSELADRAADRSTDRIGVWEAEKGRLHRTKPSYEGSAGGLPSSRRACEPFMSVHRWWRRYSFCGHRLIAPGDT